MIWDAVVAGTGPAGAVAAHGLARGGMRVLMLDRPESGPKVGEALPGAASRLLAACGLPALSTLHGHRPLTGTLSAWGSDALDATDFLHDPDGPGWRLDRGRFDSDLREAACDASAGCRAGRLRTIERRDSSWKISTDDGTIIYASWLIDATGRSAAVARRVGAIRLRTDDQIAVFGIGAGECAPCLVRTMVEARPEGWWYAARLPAGGVLASYQVGTDEARRLLRSPARWHEALAATTHLSVTVAGIGFRERLRAVEAGSAHSSQLCGEGWIACGDAAIAFDPISGQGLFSALHGGMMAARVLLASEDLRAAMLADYVQRHVAIRAAYRRHWFLAYTAERRWSGKPYWASRTGQTDLGA